MSRDLKREQALALVTGQLPETLPAIEDGWRIRQAFGHKTWKLAPPRVQGLVRVLAWVPATLFFGFVATTCALSFRFLGGTFWYLWLGQAKVFVTSVAAVGVALGRASTRL